MVKGYDADPASPLGNLLRRKQLYCYVTLPEDTATKPTLGKEVIRRFEAISPMVDWLNQTILAAKPQDDANDARPKRPTPMF